MPLQHKPISAGKQIQRTSTTSTLPTSLPLLLPCPQRPSPSLPDSSCLLYLSQAPSPRLPHSCMPHAPPQPHVPHISHHPHLPFLLHSPCPIMWVHLSCLDHGMLPPSIDAGSQAMRYYTCSQASQMASLSLGSSPAISVSIALNLTQAPQPQSV